ncbi:MAG TPA: tRNA (adenosine(37)-N6)-threonylcarbamoyltransferase complex dimerization subunit type 1 TsaB [Steroidobacteraceae bacterium]|nr:tRNA (adenosine(37)-N6)-threonylcarbamoyltransferase complex dimerization subunit type 1 TsaB [Steroidobacteraceae bacterium]
MKLLALDTATECCSVALWQDGEVQIRERKAERGHGAHILNMIDEALATAGWSLGSLDAIAFGRGPGAFTGLRLAASLTQGLAYAAGLPVIPVSDLRALAQQALTIPQPPARTLACLDARMGELYWAGFDCVGGYARAATAEAVAGPEAVIAAARLWLDGRSAAGAGPGYLAHPQLASGFSPPLQPILAQLAPHAREIARLAAHDGLALAVPAEQALPVYLRDNVALVPGQAPPIA